jgi:hypothetical protein
MAVQMSAYAEFQKVVKNVDYYGRSAFSFCFMSVLSQVAEEMEKRGYNEKIAMVFDNGSLMPLVYLNKGNFSRINQLGGLSFLDDEDTPPLQAADLIAWETHKYAVAKLAGSDKMSDTLMFLAHRDIPPVRIWDTHGFRRMLEDFREVSLDGVPLGFDQTPEGQTQGFETFARNKGKIDLAQPLQELSVRCQPAALVEGRFCRNERRKSRNKLPICPPIKSEVSE